MKKIAAILLVIVTAVSFYACSVKTDGGEDVIDGLKKAANDAVEYEFFYPEEWEIFEDDGSIGIRYDVNTSDAYAEYASIIVTAFGLEDAGISALDYWASYENDIKSVFPTYEKLDESEARLGSTVAVSEKYKASMSGIDFVFEQMICVRSGSVYIVTLTVKEADYESVAEAFDTVCLNFTFKD